MYNHNSMFISVLFFIFSFYESSVLSVFICFLCSLAIFLISWSPSCNCFCRPSFTTSSEVLKNCSTKSKIKLYINIGIKK